MICSHSRLVCLLGAIFSRRFVQATMYTANGHFSAPYLTMNRTKVSDARSQSDKNDDFSTSKSAGTNAPAWRWSGPKSRRKEDQRRTMIYGLEWIFYIFCSLFFVFLFLCMPVYLLGRGPFPMLLRMMKNMCSCRNY